MKEKETRPSDTLNVEEIKQILQKRKAELEEQMRQIHKDTIARPDVVMDTSDQEQQVMQELLNISLENNEFQEYQMILKALKRIEAGDYGVCIECDKAISPRRLLLYPNATRCLVCQEAFEENQL